MKTPRVVEIAITSKCNLRCKYCAFFTSASDVNTDLPKEEWFEFFKELRQCSVANVTLSGGEPLYRQDIREIIEEIVRNKMRFWIATNGTLVTEEIAEFLASTRRCGNIQISIDGANSTSHDACRGRGKFLQTMEGIKILQKYQLPISVRVTIHRNNYNEIEEIARLLLEEIGLSKFAINTVNNLGLGQRNAKSVQVDAHERSLVMETLLKLNKKYNRNVVSGTPLAQFENWLMMKSLSKSNKKPLNLPGGYLQACGQVEWAIAVRSDGIITPCSLLSHMELGKINRDSLRVIWQKHPAFNKLRERTKIPLTQFDSCKKCNYNNLCSGGGCPATAYLSTGEENSPDTNLCLKSFLAEGGKLSSKLETQI